jgi:sugar O-acyltransferase (sialic acid O-acetyltransferase NeuD family)
MKRIVLGAGGHAKEVLEILASNKVLDISLIDNTINTPSKLFGFDIYNKNEVLSQFDTFYLGVGNIRVRNILSSLGLSYNLTWKGIRSQKTSISNFEVTIDKTVDIMDGVQISSSVTIGKGTLLNRNTNIHHDVEIGSFCEVAPNSILLGKVKVGNNVFIGAGSIILPNVIIEDNAVIGAGSVVTKNVVRGTTVVGIPAKKIKK